MSAYRLWTLTCDGCGEIFDCGSPYGLDDVKRQARRCGWTTGRVRLDNDYCRNCTPKEDR